jgi:hypothetical protein
MEHFSTECARGGSDQQSRGKMRAGELEFVSRDTAARMIARSVRTISRLAEAGELTALYPEGSRYMFFRRSDIEQYIGRLRSQASARL